MQSFLFSQRFDRATEEDESTQQYTSSGDENGEQERLLGMTTPLGCDLHEDRKDRLKKSDVFRFRKISTEDGTHQSRVKRVKRNNPPKDIPIKIELVPRARFFSFEISEMIAFATGITPSIRPCTNRITTLRLKLEENPKATIQITFTII